MADAPAPPAPQAAPEAPQATPAPVPGGQATAVPAAEPEPDPALPPRHAELGKWAAKAKAQRDQQAQRDADARDAAAYRAMLAQGFTPQQATQQVQQQRPPVSDLDINDFDALAGRFQDPGKLREWLNGFAKHIANPQAGRLHREVEQLKARQPEGLDEIKAAVQQLQQERAREQQTAVQREFIAATVSKNGEAPAYPLLSRHPEQQRVAAANQVIADYRAAGYDGELSMDLVLQGAEDLLTNHYRTLGFLPAAEPTSPAPTAVPDVQPEPAKRSPSTTTRRPPGSRSISNDHVATPTSPKPQTYQERLAWAKQRAEQRTRSR